MDIFTEDPVWYASSSRLLSETINRVEVFVNPVIYAEVSVRFERIEELKLALPESIFKKANIPWEADF